MTTERNKSVVMHKDYFDRAKEARQAGFNLEAVFLEYAAIEGRLEVLCGLFGCPCNKNLELCNRKIVNISQRIKCLTSIYREHPVCVDKGTKTNIAFWKKLKNWISYRNRYVHGLYKNTEEYVTRKQDSQQLADDGFEHARLLYNEVKRIRRLYKNHPEEMVYDKDFCKAKCSFLKDKEI